MPSQTYNSGSGTWNSPADIGANVWVYVWAGGGGGGSGGGTGGGGGGGGAYSTSSFAVTPSTGYPYSVGAGGAAGLDGADSTFNTTTVVALKGGAGNGAGSGGMGGASAGGTGTTKYSGGNGANNDLIGTGGAGGGSSAGVQSDGTNGTANSGSSGGGGGTAPRGGGDGGAGGNNAVNGTAGQAPGGGGGGSGAGATGGAGANGRIQLMWWSPENIEAWSPSFPDFFPHGYRLRVNTWGYINPNNLPQPNTQPTLDMWGQPASTPTYRPKRNIFEADAYVEQPFDAPNQTVTLDMWEGFEEPNPRRHPPRPHGGASMSPGNPDIPEIELDKWNGCTELPPFPPKPKPEGLFVTFLALANQPSSIDGWSGADDPNPRAPAPRPHGFTVLPVLPRAAWDWFDESSQNPLPKPLGLGGSIEYPVFSPVAPFPFDWLPESQPAQPVRTRAIQTALAPGENPHRPEPFDWLEDRPDPVQAGIVARTSADTIQPPALTAIPLVGGTVTPEVGARGGFADYPQSAPIPGYATATDWEFLETVPPRVEPEQTAIGLNYLNPPDSPTGWASYSAPPNAEPATVQAVGADPLYVVSAEWVADAATASPVARTEPRPRTETVEPPPQSPYDLLVGWAPEVEYSSPRSAPRPAGGTSWVWSSNPTPPTLTGRARVWWVADPGLRVWIAGVAGMGALVRNDVTKSAGDTLRIAMDWGDVPELIAGATLSSVTITAATGVTISGQQNDTTYRTSAVFAGGSSGNSYEITFAATLSTGSIVSRTATLKVV